MKPQGVVGVARAEEPGVRRMVAVPLRLHLTRWLTWPEILDRVALVTGLTAEACLHQRDGPGRPLALWVARRFGGMTLREVGQMAGGMDYTAVAMALKRFEQRAANNGKWRELMRELQSNCEK